MAAYPEAGGPTAPKKEAGIAVVELFTSEGCSSCPAADKLLGERIADAKRHGRRVYGLAFHVDYWDHLGWKDPFGSRLASLRQQGYARLLGKQGVYTPQMIVNGTDEFVGSDAARAERSIRTALARPVTATVTLKTEASDKAGRLKLHYEVAGAPAEAYLQIAFVESEQTVKVPRGENAGRKLKHFNVVKGFQSVDMAKAPKGDVDLRLPAPGVGTIIAYVQDTKNVKIVGAAAVEIKAAETEKKP